MRRFIILLGVFLNLSFSQTSFSAVDILPYFDTRAIEKALKTYEQIAERGGWKKVSHFRKLEKGQVSPHVLEVRERLFVTGDLEKRKSTEPELFDETLEGAVKRFQYRHGLNEDGVIGTQTLQALNVSVEERIAQLRLSLERLKTFSPEDLGERYLLVNVPAFTLDVVEEGRSLISMRTIVGQVKKEHRTPLFSEDLSYLVLNPVWNVPESIATKELLPKIKEDPTYFEKQNYKLISVKEGQRQEVDPKTINWTEIEHENFEFEIKQKSGRGNALGTIKFMFPNRYNVYLHDTSARSLFEHNVRSFSHGCVRIEKPMELAKYLLRDQPEWTVEKINAGIRSEGEKHVMFKTKVPVHIQYHTAWVDGEGRVHFRRDIYGYDRAGMTSTVPKE